MTSAVSNLSDTRYVFFISLCHVPPLPPYGAADGGRLVCKSRGMRVIGFLPPRYFFSISTTRRDEGGGAEKKNKIEVKENDARAGETVDPRDGGDHLAGRTSSRPA